MDEASRNKARDELDFNVGDPSDEAHEKLKGHGYKKVSDGRWSHHYTGKEVTLAHHEGRVSHAFVTEDVIEEDSNNKTNGSFPVMILLRRKAIRNFPNGQRVGLYYSDKLDRYVSIPAAQNNATVAEEVVEEVLEEGVGKPVPVSPTGENTSTVLSHLKGIVANREPGHVHFRNGSKMKIDMLTAHALLTTYDRLTHPENKVHFDRKLNRDNPSFLKMVEFAHKHYIGNNDMGAPTGQSMGSKPKPKPKSPAASNVKKAAVKKSVKNK